MIKAYTAESIILARNNFGEADKVITIFSKNQGKKKVIAKGIRRIRSRRAPHLELFSHSMLVLHPAKSLDIVTEATCVENFSLARRKIERIGFIYIALELTERLTAELVPTPAIFYGLKQFLHTLNSPNTRRSDAEVELKVYKTHILSELGFFHPAQVYNEIQLDNEIENILESSVRSNSLLTRIQSLV